MTEITFAPAVRERVKLRMAVIGGPGSGKTIGALYVARAIGGKWFGIDTEHGRMRLYADKFKFEHGDLPKAMRKPEGYIEAFRAALAHGAEGVIIDSLSHEWLAVLEEADKFGDWKDLTPRHRDCVEEIVSAPVHVIVTLRSKVEYEVTEEDVGGRKKQKIVRLGVGPVFGKNAEYEFDVLAYLDDETHEAHFMNRCDALVGKRMPLDEAAPVIVEWLEHGDPNPAMMRATDESVRELRALLIAQGQSEGVIDDAFRKVASRSSGVLTQAWVDEKIAKAHEREAGSEEAQRAKPPEPPPAPKTWAEIVEQLDGAYGPQAVKDFEAFVVDVSQHLYRKPVTAALFKQDGPLNRTQWVQLLQRSAGACARLLDSVDGGGMPPSRRDLREAFAPAVEGAELPGPPWAMGPDEDKHGKPRAASNGVADPAAQADAAADAESDPETRGATWEPTDEERAAALEIPFGGDGS